MKLVQVNAWQAQLRPYLIDFIKKEQPDILCMQEVLHSNAKNNYVPLFRLYNLTYEINQIFLEYYLSPIFSFKSFGTKIDLGNSIFSNSPITSENTFFVNGTYVPRMTKRKFKKNIVNLQMCEIKVGRQQSITVANHHGYHDFNPLGNHKSPSVMSKVADHLGRARYPLIFCGDLNLSPDSLALKELDRLGLRNLTKESGVVTTLNDIHYAKKDVVCDYIFVSKDIKVRSFVVSDEIVSDHKALILEFDI